jgi:hypothetical protein
VLALRRDPNGGWIAHPGPARLKLFPTIAERVLRASTSGALLNPSTSKMIVKLTAEQSSNAGVPLHALFVLARSRHGISVRTLRGRDAFLEVIRSAFNLIRLDKARLQNQFAVTAQLVADVPVRRLSYPRRLASLNAVCSAVLRDRKGTA